MGKKPTGAKRYRVQHQECCNFVAGATLNGEQVLLGVVGKEPLYVVAAFFTKAGAFLREESRSVEVPATPGLNAAEDEEQQVNALWEAVEEWKKEIDLQVGDVEIATFDLPNWDRWGFGIGISDLPRFMVISNMADAIAEFRSNEQFVLRWGTEYWMSVDGEITDT
jgi:hypothetical protein